MKKISFINGSINFMMRASIGAIAIYFTNEYLISQGSVLQVGLNVVTFVTSGILGIPGVAMLYGIIFFQNM